MTACRSIAGVEAAADIEAAGEEPLSQETADQAAAILAAARPAQPA